MMVNETCRRLGRLGGAAVVLILAGAALPGQAEEVSGNSGLGQGIVEPGRTLFGRSYNDLADQWTNWLAKEPIATNPALDNDGRNCDRNQAGSVWYLAGTFGGALGEDAIANRHCEIPAGKAIFLPIFANISFPGIITIEGCDELRGLINQVRCDINNGTPWALKVGLKVVIDGSPVNDLFAYRVQSPPGGFTARIAPGSPLTAFGVSPGPHKPAVVDGYFIFLRPLPPGNHTVSFSADFDVDGSPDLGANYRLSVQ